MRPRFRPCRGMSIPCLLAAAFLLAPSARAEAGLDASDPVQAGYLEAYARGMPLDSLSYLLSGHALRKLSYDTAMAFNLSIPTPPSGGFRDSVLAQRYRLYLLAGLRADAAALKDSVPALAVADRPRRRVEWEAKVFSGYGREDQSGGRIPPAAIPLGAFRTGGWLAHHQAAVLLPLPGSQRAPLSLGLGYDVAKSYYKDSVDYRAEARLKADRILDRFSAALTAEAGRISGVGAVSAFKAEAAWMDLHRDGGFLIGNAGYESEWEGFDTRRYDAAWTSVFREWGLASGRAAHVSVSATWLRMDPLDVQGSHPVIFVDDPRSASPTHYRDGSYSDSLSRSRITAYQQYTTHTAALEVRCPQSVLTLGPSLGFALPLGAGVRAELGGSYAWSLYPEYYRWVEYAGGDPFAGDSSTFHALARSRADGRYYPAYLDNRTGNLRESYGSEPLAERRVRRTDHHLGGDLALKRRLAGWGSLVLALGARRTFSSLAGEAPLWTPGWEYDASLRWTRTGAWP